MGNRQPLPRRKFIKQVALVAATFPFINSCRQNTKSPSTDFLNPESIREFRKKFGGQIILPVDDVYEKRRWSRVINPNFDKHPAIIATCKQEDDISRSIEFARKHQLEIAVRSGNHSNMGWGTCEKGMVIDVSRMKEIKVDAQRQTAIVSAGASAAEILAATAPYGLAPVLGECGTVGAGIVLGGGLGWLAGKYGATCDNLISARVITAEADSLRADAAVNSDLFWAIRGGGGNFGVASLFEYKLHPVKEIVGGSFFYSRSKARDIIRFFNEFMFNAPDELQGDCYVSRDQCWVEFVYFGQLTAGEELLNKFRQFSKPDNDTIKRKFFSEVYQTPVDNSPQPRFNSDKGTYIEKLTDDAIDTILDGMARAPKSGAPYCNLSHYMHGEVCRVLPDATAFELRKDGGSHLAYWISWQNQEDTDACIKWHNETADRLWPFAGGRIYSNYMSSPGGSNARSVYGSNTSRLAQIKKKFDPNNIFHLNQNILPA